MLNGAQRVDAKCVGGFHQINEDGIRNFHVAQKCARVCDFIGACDLARIFALLVAIKMKRQPFAEREAHALILDAFIKRDQAKACGRVEAHAVALGCNLVWRDVGLGGAIGPLALYVVSPMLNAAWSGVFFGMKRPDLAFYELIELWLSIAAMIVVFMPLQQTAALLLVPYLAWVTFAGALNFSIWRLNKDALA